jgi:SRSO17 transposase
MFMQIKEELERLYWEKYQKIIENPFEDTGTTYQNKTFTVRAYKKDNNKEPNFETENIKVWWHKSEGKDNYIETTPCFDNPTNYAITLNKCLAALQKDFIADKK